MENVGILLTESGYITISKILTFAIGMEKGFFLFLFISEAEQSKEEWFVFKRVDVQEKWKFTFLKQRKFTKRLVEEGFLSIKKCGMPKTNRYKVNFDKIKEAMDEATPRYEEFCRKEIEAYNKEIARWNK